MHAMTRRLALRRATTLAAGAAAALALLAGPVRAAELAEGEVRKIDAAAGKLTLKHGEIKRLEMPPMTMVFKVRDAAMLAPLKVGDKVRFDVEKQGASYVVTRLEPAK